MVKKCDKDLSIKRVLPKNVARVIKFSSPLVTTHTRREEGWGGIIIKVSFAVAGAFIRARRHKSRDRQVEKPGCAYIVGGRGEG